MLYYALAEVFIGSIYAINKGEKILFAEFRPIDYLGILIFGGLFSFLEGIFFIHALEITEK
jgi:hypothetical protein